LDALMPIAAGIEERWKYWVPQPLTDEGTGNLSIRDIKILDPACGSGHFLVIAFDLLLALYQEEARHRGEEWSEEWSEEWIAVSILENNLHGVDIDPRAVQIAAAALVLKARRHGASLKVVNLVASNLQLASLPEEDLALVELKREVRETTGIPEELTQQIVQALKGADQWGSLLKIDGAVEGAIATYEKGLIEPLQISLPFISAGEVVPVVATLADSAMRKDLLLEKLERFLERCTKGDDLGLRLRGEQLAAGVRFIRLIREGAYDLVVGNPPYLGASKMADAKFLAVQYPKGKADLYAVFLERGLQLVKPGGMSALLTMRNWMFIQQFSGIREHLLKNFDLRLLGDVDRGAFEETMDEVMATTMSIFRNAPPNEEKSIAIQPTPLNDNARDSQRTKRKRAAVLAQVGRFEFRSDRFRAIKEQPIVYWWDEKFLKSYAKTPKMGASVEMWQGVATTSNTRFLRFIWEIDNQKVWLNLAKDQLRVKPPIITWVPYVKGAKGRAWFDSISDVIEWDRYGLQLGVCQDFYRIKHPALQLKDSGIFFRIAVAYSTIGASFRARLHRFRSIFDVSGSSVFPQKDEALICCLMNSEIASSVLASWLTDTSPFLEPEKHIQTEFQIRKQERA